MTNLLREPLWRLLAINLAIGTAVTALFVAGLYAFDLYGLRELIAADRAPLVALGLLFFGCLITFGSVAMGSAIMAIGGNDDGRDGGQRSKKMRDETGQISTAHALTRRAPAHRPHGL
jgi:hypothetical protein